MAEMCFTDHAPNPDGVGAKYAMGMNEFNDYRRMIIDIQDDKLPAVFFGVEADYYPGCAKHFSKWLTAGDFDLVLGSIHYLGNWGFDSTCLLYTSPSPRDRTRSRMPSSA